MSLVITDILCEKITIEKMKVHRRAKGFCINGHDLENGANLYRSGCRICRRLCRKQYMARKRKSLQQEDLQQISF